MQAYLKNGEDIFNKYCSLPTSHSIMFPKAPSQSRVDIYPEEDTFKDECKRQDDYEGEVKVYRAVERLENYLKVLHGFKYTHDQNCVIDGSHRKDKSCKKAKFDIEGECDFLILGFNFCVIIEVKNMYPVKKGSKNRHSDIKALVGTFRKSVEQRSKIKSLVESIEKDKPVQVLAFTAYPNFGRSFKSQFEEVTDAEPLSKEELDSVIFQEDLSCDLKEVKRPSGVLSFGQSEQTTTEEASTSSDQTFKAKRPKDTSPSLSDNSASSSSGNKTSMSQFSYWWELNVTSKVPPAQTQLSEKLRHLLLAVWGNDIIKENGKSKCKFDPFKFRFDACIRKIDDQLRSGRITSRSSDESDPLRNTNVRNAPKEIREYIGVEKLTSKQLEVFNSPENMLWINGAAGTGKSVLLCGKMIQLLQKDNKKKVVLSRVRTKKEGTQFYEAALRKAGISYSHISDSQTRSTIESEIRKSESNVIIVEINAGMVAANLTGYLSLLEECHVFIDDLQVVINSLSSPDDVSKLLDKLLELSKHSTVRVACDMVQHWLRVDTPILQNRGVILNKLSGTQLISLSMNLRNTSDVADILCVFRDMYIEYLYQSKKEVNRISIPEQVPGHYIHGPKTTFHILSNQDQIISIVAEELDKLTSTDHVLNYSEIGVVCNHLYDDVESSVSDSVKVRCSNSADMITVCDSSVTYSVEWPAVIVIHGLLSRYDDEKYLLPQLYLLLSRARVYCSVVLFTEEEGYKVEDTKAMSYLLDKLGDRVLIRRH